MSEAAAHEWRLVVSAGVVVTAVLLVVLAVWAIRDATVHDPTRLERAIRCFEVEKGFAVDLAVDDPLARSAGAGALKTTIEGNEVTIVLTSTQNEAARIESDYRALGSDLKGRLERRDRTVWLWKNVSSPTQRQHAYDCQY